MMPHSEEAESELLWRYIVDTKNAEGDSVEELAYHPIHRASELSSLASLVGSVHQVMQRDAASRQEKARVQLLALIGAESGVRAPSGRGARRGLFGLPIRLQVAFAALLLLLTAVAFGVAYQHQAASSSGCPAHPRAVTPAAATSKTAPARPLPGPVKGMYPGFAGKDGSCIPGQKHTK